MKNTLIGVLSFLLLILYIFPLVSCTSENPPTNETIPTNETTEVVTTEEPRPTMNNPKVYYVEGRRYEIFYKDSGGKACISYARVENEDLKAFEIELPADGETIKYDTPLVIYESPEGEKISFESVSNSGGNITFQGVKSDIVGRINLYSPDTCYADSRNNKTTNEYTLKYLEPTHKSYESSKEFNLNRITNILNARQEEFNESKCYVWVWDYDPIDFDYDPLEDTEMWEKWETD